MKRMKTLDKKYQDAFLWKPSISNHLWRSEHTSERFVSEEIYFYFEVLFCYPALVSCYDSFDF